MRLAVHRIRKHRWLVRTCTASDAFAIRARVRDQLQSVALRALERAFDKASTGDSLLHIPRIDIRLTMDVLAGPEEVLEEAMCRQLAEHIRSVPEEEIPASAATNVPDGFAGHQSPVAILVHYLQTGSIPWPLAHTASPDVKTFLREVYLEHRAQVLHLLRVGTERSQRFFRLLELLTEAETVVFHRAIVEHVFGAWNESVDEFISFLLHERSSELIRIVRLQVAAVVLDRWMECSAAGKPLDISHVVRQALSPGDYAAFCAFIETLPAKPAALFVRDNGETSGGIDGSTETPVRHGHRDRTAPFMIEERLEGEHHEAPNTTNSLIGGQPAMSNEDDNSSTLVRNAGLIIVHPFIPRLFENTGTILMPGGIDASPPLLRAAAILYFLATRNEEVHEYDLGLIKVMLGLSPEVPLLITGGLLTDSDKEESEALLASVIEHWSTLKNTSVDGLRKSFLQRNALMQKDDAGWQLRFERLAFDVLLGRLPWSIGVVKFPWMKKAIYTEW